MPSSQAFATSSSFCAMAFCLLISLTHSQTQIGTSCIFTPGQKMNCREYCETYFKSAPQLAWYNLTSHQCEPLKWCSWMLHFYDYNTNQCYTDATLTKVAPSEYPDTLIENRIATFYIDMICVNGVPETGLFSDARCYCYFLWQDSGKIDINGYPYKCDQVVEPEQWKGYFFKDVIKAPDGTIIMYGQYTLEQLQVVYEQMKEKEAEQTQSFVYKYQASLLGLIKNQLNQESLIRDHQLIWFLIALGVFYVIFAFSYLRGRNLKIKVTKKELVQRIKSVLNDNSAIQAI